LLTWNQRVGLALEALAYENIKVQLRKRIGDAGTERSGLNGPVWEGGSYTLFWHQKVVRRGQYPKNLKGARRRFADIVLCDEDLSEIVPYNAYAQNETPPFQGIFSQAILALECKNYRLDFRWGHQSHVKTFDADILRRFIWADSTGPSGVDNVLGFDVDWERYAGFQNLFPQAEKALLMPRFRWLKKSKSTPRGTGSLEYWLQKASELLGSGKDTQVIAHTAWKLSDDLRAPSYSARDEIEWRIRRLRLHVLELGHRPMPDKPIPARVNSRLTQLLMPYIAK
jgi:hypothetical protein